MQRQKSTENLQIYCGGGAIMTELTPALPESLNKEDLVSNIRTLISQHWEVAVEYITLQSNFFDDLGLDWLDVIELTVLIEQQFPDLTVADDVQLASLDDLIQNIQIGDSATDKDAAWPREEHGHLRMVT
jgi:acyl carrier protein